ncbi:hypothetical protein [Cupriavidus sp. BIS7]|uniref:hypothetical protein n=1 Tax=Cupriavidus sp. BIS7 TaxID=1217718 RepID=UPI0003068FBA|nr:hypothetical protein [Cupriavidus sp. BIS7]
MHPSFCVKSVAVAMAAVAVAVAVVHAQVPSPEIRESGGVPYVSGGVGIDDVSQMKALAPGFNVRLRFADESNGNSLSDVLIVVLDERNERVLRVRTEGPLLYMKLPPGRYLLAMAYLDSVRQLPITVGRTPMQLTIGFHVEDVDVSLQRGHDSSR